MDAGNDSELARPTLCCHCGLNEVPARVELAAALDRAEGSLATLVAQVAGFCSRRCYDRERAGRFELLGWSAVDYAREYGIEELAREGPGGGGGGGGTIAREEAAAWLAADADAGSYVSLSVAPDVGRRWLREHGTPRR